MATPETNKEREKPLVIECADGRTRLVSFQTGTKLVARSVVISEGSSAGEAIEKQGLTDRQKRGLGVPLRTRPEEFLPPDEPNPEIL